MKKIAVFASGNGSNFQAICEAIQKGRLRAEIACAVCDQPKAYVIERAKGFEIPVVVLKPRDFENKAAYEHAILEKLQEYGVEWLVLAGYMRLIGSTLLNAYERRIVNIHPSLLPSFPGLHAVEKAFEAEAKTTGVTIHYVDEGMDTGPIIAQQAVQIEPNDTLKSIEARIHQIEHELYPAVLDNILNT